jgi:UDP-N-acetylmuramoyl-tripeptide--D-alanyl-D-alanine ligase
VFELRQAFDWLSAARLSGDPTTRISGVCTDTRVLQRGELFVALRGERFDAHAFLRQAQAGGAAAVLFEGAEEAVRPPALLVPDSRRALGEIAAGWRRGFRLPLIAVTGSNGKTTVKEMLAAILAEAFGKTHRLATEGNLNNEIGVPLTLLRLDARHRAAVVELGMNRPGEIAWLARIAAPTVALVNNAQREHQEFMQSVEATARENGQAIAALDAEGIAVFPGDDVHAPLWRELAGTRRCIEFGLRDEAVDHGRFAVSADRDAQPAGFRMAIAGRAWPVRLAIDGAHNVRNALAAAACAFAAGIAPEVIVAGLERFRPVTGRLVRFATHSGAALIDDSYNANPDSARAAVDVLAALPSPRILVLGDMGEVGESGPQFHREIGEYARERGLEHLLALGDATRETAAAFGARAEHFQELAALVERADALALPPATLLVKGSRFMRMERVVSALVPDRSETH